MAGAGSKATQLIAGTNEVPLEHDDRERPYQLHVPAAALTATGVPLVVQLHGRGIDAVQFDRWTGFRAMADESGFVLALPSAVAEIWNDGRYPAREGIDDVGYLLAVIDDIGARLPVDPRRVFVVGMSNGAAMAGRLACEASDRIAAVAQVAGTIGLGLVDACRRGRPVPILQIHGASDSTAPYAGGNRRGILTRLMMIRNPAGPAIGVDAWARLWVERNGAVDGPLVTTLPPDTTIRAWHGPSPASDVVFYRVDGGGHAWPGCRIWYPDVLLGRTTRTFDATRVIWEFFARH
jgi:polyhydroxybutyrate depolymerase